MSKTAVSDSLQCEKSSLPQPNCLPATFKEARAFVAPFLMPLEKHDVCINDCVIFRDSGDLKLARDNVCPKCSEPRMENGKSRKIFSYMPIGPRLARWFGTSNLCKLIYEKTITYSGSNRDVVLKDFTDSSQFHSWYAKGQVFEEMDKQLCVPLSLFTDGVNPNRNSACQKSMWPIILTWITLPTSIRQLLGPMMLMGIIPSGKNGAEPKSLEPYLSVVVDELLSLTEFTVHNSYTSAPVSIKVALLQYLCDIPGYSKLLHLSGHGGLRSCPYCTETGHYCKHLKKTIHISNRRFLSADHPLRNSEGFATQGQDMNSKPEPFSREEEIHLRNQYERKPNKSQKTNHQKQTDLKGQYILQNLPYHNRIEQMSPDGMHTLADFISHLMEMLSGKFNNLKVKSCEKEFSRFPQVWPESGRTDVVQPKKKRKVQKTEIEECHSELETPWSLTKEQMKLADERAMNIVYTHAQEIFPGPHFTKIWTLRKMNSKFQFVTSGAFEWCIRGFLPPAQEKTLQAICDVIKRMVAPELTISELPQLQADTHEALAMLERDFPLTMQNLTTHLIHHIVDDLAKLGPMYGRWLFPYERANGWITRQCLKKGIEESTVMETYVVYDWCIYMILSQKFNPRNVFGGEKSLMKISQQIMEEMSNETSSASHNQQPTKNARSLLTKEMCHYMQNFYLMDLKISAIKFTDTVTECHGTLDITDDNGRSVRYVGDKYRGNKPRSIVKLHSVNGHQFGRICFFLEHVVDGTIHHWTIVDVFPLAEKCDSLFVVEDNPVRRQLFHVSRLGKSLVYSKKQNTIWILGLR
ncbi:uncharacterized protein LOC134256449 [Saccostrea cucullata]|uniref:uncharacterized protein LOC134256449 n=1 Tax=Saccostrea cuccullata TaxID=36930 RepID=UPI002ED65DE6